MRCDFYSIIQLQIIRGISMNIYLCGVNETLSEAIDNINKNDKEGRTFALDEKKDRCYVGDEKFREAPVIINYHNTYYAPTLVSAN